MEPWLIDCIRPEGQEINRADMSCVINGTLIHVVNKVKYLGIIFGSPSEAKHSWAGEWNQKRATFSTFWDSPLSDASQGHQSDLSGLEKFSDIN
jgi:hypothetical protein